MESRSKPSYTAYDNVNSTIYVGKDSLSSVNGAGLIRYPYAKSTPDWWMMKIPKIKLYNEKDMVKYLEICYPSGKELLSSIQKEYLPLSNKRQGNPI